MKPISSRLHGILDYAVGLLLIVAPFLLDFANDGPAMWVPIILGAGTIAYSLMTDYELGMIRAIPFRAHLAVDAVAGIFLAASPWIFGFADFVLVPHVLVGVVELVVVALTRTIPVHTHVQPGGRASL